MYNFSKTVRAIKLFNCLNPYDWVQSILSADPLQCYTNCALKLIFHDIFDIGMHIFTSIPYIGFKWGNDYHFNEISFYYQYVFIYDLHLLCGGQWILLSACFL